VGKGVNSESEAGRKAQTVFMMLQAVGLRQLLRYTLWMMFFVALASIALAVATWFAYSSVPQ
jgi:hypothetical protein